MLPQMTPELRARTEAFVHNALSAKTKRRKNKTFCEEARTEEATALLQDAHSAIQLLSDEKEL